MFAQIMTKRATKVGKTLPHGVGRLSGATRVEFTALFLPVARDPTGALNCGPKTSVKRWATRADLTRKSTVSRELVADYWMEGLLATVIGKYLGTGQDVLIRKTVRDVEPGRWSGCNRPHGNESASPTRRCGQLDWAPVNTLVRRNGG